MLWHPNVPLSCLLLRYHSDLRQAQITTRAMEKTEMQRCTGKTGQRAGWTYSSDEPTFCHSFEDHSSAIRNHRDLGVLARSIKSARQGAAFNSTPLASALGRGGEGDASRCHGVSVSTSWPFSFAHASIGAGFQQVMPLGRVSGRRRVLACLERFAAGNTLGIGDIGESRTFVVVIWSGGRMQTDCALVEATTTLRGRVNT